MPVRVLDLQCARVTGGYGSLERIGLRTAAESLRLIKSGKTSLDLGAVPESTVLVGKKNRFAVDSSTRGGA